MTKTRKIISAVMSGILALMMTLNAAAMETGELPADPGPITDGEASLASAELVSEIEHLRGANERHFQASDGSYVAVSYAEQIHYQDEDGNWLEVDNTLAAETDDAGKTVYKNRDGLFDVEFAEPGDASRDTVKIKSEDYELSWKVFAASAPVAPAPQPGAAVMSQEETDLLAEQEADVLTGMQATAQMSLPAADISALSNEEKLMAAEKSASRVIYGDALGADTDVIYDVSGNRVKESILLDAYTGNYGYVTQISAPNLSAVLNEDGSVTFANEAGEKVFAVEAPYMFDDTGIHSYDIAVALKETAEGCALIYVPDAAWLADPQRAYPVVIDPTVTVYNNRTTAVTYKDDTLAWDGVTSRIDSSSNVLGVGHGGAMMYYTFIDYTDLPTLPNNATITGARQVLFISYATSTTPAVASFTLNKDYVSGSILYNNIMQSINTSSGVSGTYHTNSAGDRYVLFEYSDYDDFATYDPTTGKLHSKGFMIADPRHYTHSSSPQTFAYQAVTFHSSSSTTKTKANSTQYARPYVRISYTRNEPPEGVYMLNNVGAGFDSYINKWFFDKVEGAAAPGYSDAYGPYYLRSAYYDSAPIYASHQGGQISTVTLDNANVHLSPAAATSDPNDTNSDYYWYLYDIGNNQYRIHYTTSTVLAVKSSVSSVTYINIYDAFELKTISSTSSKQQWTLTINYTSTTFRWPLAYEEGKGSYVGDSTYQISSLWGYRYPKETAKEGFHWGIDIRTRHVTTYNDKDTKLDDVGRNVFAVADGVVKEIGYVEASRGKYVVIEHKSMLDGAGGYYTTEYLHLYSNSVVKVGQFVKQGQVIGVSGNTGKTDGAHLHLQFDRSSPVDGSEVTVNPLIKYHEKDTRSSGENPNPIYFTSHADDKDKGTYTGYNSNFIFNYSDERTWSDHVKYKNP